jgi:hypothetical protein
MIERDVYSENADSINEFVEVTRLNLFIDFFKSQEEE